MDTSDPPEDIVEEEEEIPYVTLEESGLYVGQWGMKNKYIAQGIDWN